RRDASLKNLHRLLSQRANCSLLGDSEPASVFVRTHYRPNFFAMRLHLVLRYFDLSYFGPATGFANAVVWSTTIRQPSGNFLKLRVNTPEGLSFSRCK